METSDDKRGVNMRVERTNSDELLVDKLPDGSKFIVDPKNETVFALNATAGAAWDACSAPTTLSAVAEDMRRSFDPRVSEELALEAVQQLQEQKLVTTSGTFLATTRRAFVAKFSAGAIALPLVVALTMAQQRAHAQNAGSVGGTGGAGGPG